MTMKMKNLMTLRIFSLCLFSLIGFSFVDSVKNHIKPNIIIIVADDLGWNDVGFHGSTQIPTPNIDALAYSGVILNNYYVQPICTPSRSALMTGKHPVHTGLQCHTIGGPHPYGLGLDETLLPERLESLGYVRQHVGKWHLGCHTQKHTPTFRGFQSHLGYWTGRIDYYDHTAFENPGWWGYDMRRNMSVARDAYGKYTTDLFTDEAVDIISHHNASEPLFLYLAHLAVHSGNPYAPLQAPADIVKKFSYIKDKNRRIFAGMLWKLDESVGHVVEALDAQGMLTNSIIVFTTDNGGPAAGFNQNAASNWPFRGVKASLWEGGTHGAGFVWSPLLKNPGSVSHQMFTIYDWLPTLYSAAGGNVRKLHKIDGMDQWASLVNNLPSVRNEFLVNIDPIQGGAALRMGDWKLIYKPTGFGNHWDDWFGPSGRNETAPQTDLKEIFKQIINSPAAAAVKKMNPQAFRNINNTRNEAEILCGPVPSNATLHCNDETSPCLFHIPSDPCEFNDLADKYPDIVHVLQERLSQYNATTVPPRNKPWDPAANPKYWNYTWTNWKDFPSPLSNHILSNVEPLDWKIMDDPYGDMRYDEI